MGRKEGIEIKSWGNAGTKRWEHKTARMFLWSSPGRDTGTSAVELIRYVERIGRKERNRDETKTVQGRNG